MTDIWHLDYTACPVKSSTASSVTIMKQHPCPPTNWPCDTDTTTCSWFILFTLIFHPSSSNTETRVIIPTDWSKIYSFVWQWSRAKTRILQSQSQQLHINQEISLSTKTMFITQTAQEVKITSSTSHNESEHNVMNNWHNKSLNPKCSGHSVFFSDDHRIQTLWLLFWEFYSSESPVTLVWQYSLNLNIEKKWLPNSKIKMCHNT